MSILVVFILCDFSSLKNLDFVCSIASWHLLTQASFIEVFWVFLDTSWSIARSIELFFWTLCLVDRSSIPFRSIEDFCHWYLLDSSRSIEILFFIDPRYLSIYRDIWFNIYLRFDLILIQHFNLSLFSFDPNTSFSLKSFRSLPSLNPLVCVLNLLFFLILHAF